MESPRDGEDSRRVNDDIENGVHPAASVGREPPPLPASVGREMPPLPSRKGSSWPWVVGGIVVFLASAILALVIAAVEGLSIGNIKSEGTVVSLRLANSIGFRGDVLLWIEQRGLDMCERVTAVDGQSTYDIAFQCPTLKPEQFTVRALWAAFDPEKSAVAIRIQPK